MINSKLILILETLTKKEWNELSKFVHSPFYCQHEEVKRLFDYLKKVKKLNEKTLKETTIFKNAFPEQIYDSVKLRYLRSYLLKIVALFLATKEWQSEQFNPQIALTRAYRKRNIEKLFQSNIQKLHDQEKRQSLRNVDHFQRQYQLELETYTWTESQTRRSEMNLQNLSDTLDTAFIIEKLKRSCTLLSHQAVYKKEYDTGLLDIVLEYVVTKNLLEIPAIAIYYHIYWALKKPAMIEHFQSLKSLIAIHKGLFPKEEFRNLYLLAINFCIRKINTGHSDFVKELFQLYRKGLESEALIEKGVLSRWTYKNIVAIGLGLKEFEWIAYFISHYKDFIPEIYRESSFKYNLADLYYHQKKHQTAMSLLLEITDKDLLVLLSAKTLLCKIYYELNELKLLDSHLHSFELYVRRQRAIGYHQQNYLNFTKCMKKLLALNFYDDNDVEKVKNTILKFKILPEKKWLLLQVNHSF